MWSGQRTSAVFSVNAGECRISSSSQLRQDHCALQDYLREKVSELSNGKASISSERSQVLCELVSSARGSPVPSFFACWIFTRILRRTLHRVLVGNSQCPRNNLGCCKGRCAESIYCRLLHKRSCSRFDDLDFQSTWPGKLCARSTA